MTTATLDFDHWRACYGEWTFAEQQDFYDEIWRQFPEQRRGSDEILGRFIAHIARPIEVVELGGWDGGLAADVLPDHPEIGRWLNYEISALAVGNSVCEDSRYCPVALATWYWAENHVSDLFVASHVFEHLTFGDVQRTLDASDCDWLYIQMPLGSEAQNWTGYRGTHILEVGWARLHEELAERGYCFLEEISKPMARCYER